MNDKPAVGTIGWIDLTVDDATGVRQFYEAVVGWSSSGVDMGDYDDFNMIPPGNDSPVAGVCHARGSNADIPHCWMIYIIVEDLDASLREVNERGGSIVSGPRTMGESRFCIVRDPAGAAVALYQP